MLRARATASRAVRLIDWSIKRTGRGAGTKNTSATSALRNASPSGGKTGKNASDDSITVPGQAFLGDTRSTCGVGVGDGISNHTAKWHAAAEAEGKTPIEYCQSAEPVKVRGLSVACTGLDGDDAFEMGSPVQFISLKGTSRERPAVCKYTGRKWWSDDWRGGGAH